MKKLILLLIVVFTFCSCINHNKCRQVIQSKYPYAEIIRIEETPYYLVIDSAGIRLVSSNTPLTYGINCDVLIKRWNYENRN